MVSVQDVWDLGRQAENELVRILGSANGRKIFQFCNGIDQRPVEEGVRKTIGAEVSVDEFALLSFETSANIVPPLPH